MLNNPEVDEQHKEEESAAETGVRVENLLPPGPRFLQWP